MKNLMHIILKNAIIVPKNCDQFTLIKPRKEDVIGTYVDHNIAIFLREIDTRRFIL